MSAIMPLQIQLVCGADLVPFPLDWCLRLWGWLHEHPEAHLDDTAPTTVEGFAVEIAARLARGERIWGVLVDEQPAGAIGYAPMTARVGMLHGVCVSRKVSGRGIADTALRQVLEQLQADGVEKVSATYFADNAHIRACLTRVGFRDEGFLQDQTVRNRIPVSMWLVAKFLKAG